MDLLIERKANDVVGIALGKNQYAFKEALVTMGVRETGSEDIRSLNTDISKSYINGDFEAMPKVNIVFDCFQIVRQLNEAIDKFRMLEQRQGNELKVSLYLRLRNYAYLTVSLAGKVDIPAEAYLALDQAYRLRELFKQEPDEALMGTRLRPFNDWIKADWASCIKFIQESFNMLRTHWYVVGTYFEKLPDNAFDERINLKIQEIKGIAKVYRNINNFILMIYFHIGVLDLQTHSKWRRALNLQEAKQKSIEFFNLVTYTKSILCRRNY